MDGAQAVTLRVPDALDQIKRNAAEMVRKTDELKVSTPARCEEALELIRSLKEVGRQFDALLDPIVKANHTAWKTSLQQKAVVKDPIEKSVHLLQGKVSIWRQKQQEREQKALQEEQRKLREHAEDDHRATLADLRNAGADAEAAMVAAQGPQVPIAQVPSRVPTLAGQSTRKNYTASVVNKAKLIAAVAEGRVSPEALSPNMTYLNARARADKEHLDIPGVEVRTKETDSFRRDRF